MAPYPTDSGRIENGMTSGGFRPDGNATAPAGHEKAAPKTGTALLVHE
jgi:hypothetical protein